MTNYASETIKLSPAARREYTPTLSSTATSWTLGRIILLYILSACHCASTLALIISVSTGGRFTWFGSEKPNFFDASLISLDIITIGIMLGWSGIQILIAYKLNSHNALKACALCWVVSLVEAAFIAVFVFGLFGSAPTNANPFRTASSIILGLIAASQIAYTLVISSLVGATFPSTRMCSRAASDYELLV